MLSLLANSNLLVTGNKLGAGSGSAVAGLIQLSPPSGASSNMDESQLLLVTRGVVGCAGW